jgi:hypothetical protein
MLIGYPTVVQPIPPSALRLEVPPITKSPRSPKGVPTPSELPLVIAYVSYKHWQKVVSALNQDLRDVLVLEGTVDPDTQTTNPLWMSPVRQQEDYSGHNGKSISLAARH